MRAVESCLSALGQPFAVSFKGTGKLYGGIRALRNVSFDVKPGEIMALLGENGAGKSTILKILRGVANADEGSVTVCGATFAAGAPVDAKSSGVAMIFQEMSLIPELTVAQNIFLKGERTGRLGLVDDATAEQEASALFRTLGVDINPRALVGRLSAGQRQLTEIAKAISQRSRVLVLDEPSTALTEAEVSRLFGLLKRLKSEGVAIIYVSHRMDEIYRVADRVTILRDGEHVVTCPLSALSMEQLIEKIIGRRGHGLGDIAYADADKGPEVLALRGVSTKKLRDVNLSLRSGEILGVAGLICSGRSALARALFGVDRITSGEIRIQGKPVAIRRPGDAIALGLALVPEDRAREGVVRDHSVADNIALPSLQGLATRSWISQKSLQSLVRRQIESLRIKARTPNVPVRTLSGGNQQKAVIGKWLATRPRILVLDEPTSGIDIGSKTEILALLKRLAAEGLAVIVISSELSELLAVADRIVIMSDGRVARDLPRSAFVLAADRDGGEAAAGLAERKLNNAIQEAARAAEAVQ